MTLFCGCNSQNKEYSMDPSTDTGTGIQVQGELRVRDWQGRALSILIIDESGSMRSYAEEVVQSVNQHIATMRETAQVPMLCTIVCFSDSARVALPPTLVGEVGDFSDYHPDSNTLLYGTVDTVIRRIGEQYTQLDRNARDANKVVLAVFSDGQDNRSDSTAQPYSLKRAADRVRRYGWELMTMGIGVDGPKLAECMGFPTDPDHAFTFARDEGGVSRSMHTMSHSTTVWTQKGR